MLFKRFMPLISMHEAAKIHLKIFEDLMLYGQIQDKTLETYHSEEREWVKETYKKVYEEWDL